MEMDPCEEKLLLPDAKSSNNGTTVVGVYKRRWWVTMVFCFVCALQAMIWNSWGPVAESTELIFTWSDGNIATLSNLANISYIVLVIPACMLMDTKGLRLSMLLCTILLVVCSFIRCFTLEPAVFTPLAYTSAFIQGITGTIPFSGPAAISAVWFPPEQRPTATAVVSFFNYLGVSLSFIIHPRLVPDPVYITSSKSYNKCENGNILEPNMGISLSCDMNVTNIEDIKAGIRNVMFLHMGLSVLAFLMVLIYFPNKPPIPPSLTAALERTNYKRALLDLIKNRNLWLITVAASVPVGVIGVWIAIFDVVVKPLGVSQIDAGWIGFWHTLIGCFCGIFISKFSALFSRHRKVLFIVCFLCSALCAAWIAMLCDGIVKFELKYLYLSSILLGIMINGPAPLFYEICAETAYPVAEGVAGGFYTLINSIAGVIFLSLVSLNLGTSWMTWTVFGALLIVIPMLVAFPEQYKRTDIDICTTT